jgi:hypothetical protein
VQEHHRVFQRAGRCSCKRGRQGVKLCISNQETEACQSAEFHGQFLTSSIPGQLYSILETHLHTSEHRSRNLICSVICWHGSCGVSCKLLLILLAGIDSFANGG